MILENIYLFFSFILFAFVLSSNGKWYKLKVLLLIIIFPTVSLCLSNESSHRIFVSTISLQIIGSIEALFLYKKIAVHHYSSLLSAIIVNFTLITLYVLGRYDIIRNRCLFIIRVKLKKLCIYSLTLSVLWIIADYLQNYNLLFFAIVFVYTLTYLFFQYNLFKSKHYLLGIVFLLVFVPSMGPPININEINKSTFEHYLNHYTHVDQVHPIHPNILSVLKFMVLFMDDESNYIKGYLNENKTLGIHEDCDSVLVYGLINSYLFYVLYFAFLGRYVKRLYP